MLTLGLTTPPSPGIWGTKKEEEHGQIRNIGQDPSPKRNPDSPPCPVLLAMLGVGGRAADPRKEEILPRTCSRPV